MQKLTQEYLKEILNYNLITGIFSWKNPTNTKNSIGQQAGSLHPDGYYYVKINGKSYKLSRVAWLYVLGEFPKHDVDHKNNNRSDNSWINLREANDQENSWNRKTPKNNTSGYKGVTWDKEKQKWRAKITYDGKMLHLGLFIDIMDAARAYNEAAIKYFGEFARLNDV